MLPEEKAVALRRADKAVRWLGRSGARRWEAVQAAGALDKGFKNVENVRWVLVCVA